MYAGRGKKYSLRARRPDKKTVVDIFYLSLVLQNHNGYKSNFVCKSFHNNLQLVKFSVNTLQINNNIIWVAKIISLRYLTRSPRHLLHQVCSRHLSWKATVYSLWN